MSMPIAGIPVIRTDGVTKHYRTGRHTVRAVDGVTLAVEAGEFVAIVGRSGSGKSTLLHLIGCLERPTSGTVEVAGVDVSRAPGRALPRLRRMHVGFVFQEFNLMSMLTALENVMLPMHYARVPKPEARQRAAGLLEQSGMADRLHHRPGQLSGGEQQRVALARALANKPAVVLADEPTGELDTDTAGIIVGLMHELNHAGQTFVVVTHDPAVAERARRVVRLKDGRVESDSLTRQ